MTRTPNPEWNRDLALNTAVSPQGDLLVTSVRQNFELQVCMVFQICFLLPQSCKKFSNVFLSFNSQSVKIMKSHLFFILCMNNEYILP